MSNNAAFDKSLFYQTLSPFFEANGYKWHPDTQQFRQTNETGFKNIILSPLPVGDEIHFDIQFGTRFDIVEKTLHSFISTSSTYALESNTALIKLNQFSKGHINFFRASSEPEVTEVIAAIHQFFTIKGFDYIDRLSDIHHVEDLFNGHPNLPVKLNSNPVYRCFRGITLARMVENPRWNDIHKAYLHYMEANKTPPHLVQAYMRLIEYLNAFGLN